MMPGQARRPAAMVAMAAIQALAAPEGGTCRII